MASDFLKQYAKSSREKIDREYGKKAYGGSKYKMDKAWGQTATQASAAQKPVTEPISEPVPQKKKENISFWEKLLNAFGDAGYSADTTTPLALTNQAISDDYRESNMQESKTAEAGGNIAKSAVKGAESAYESAVGAMMSKRSGTQIMGVTVADDAVSEADKATAEAARQRNQANMYAKAEAADTAAWEAREAAKDNLGGSAAAGALVDIASGGLQLGADMALNALIPGAGLASMGVRAFGNGAREAMMDGASGGEQVIYGAAQAAVQIATEKMFDVGKLFGGGAADDVAEKLIQKLAKTDTGRSIVRALTNAVGEGAEEAVSDLLTPAIRAIYDSGKSAASSYTTAEGRKELLAQSAYDAMIGAALSTFGTAAGIAKGVDAQKNAALRAGEPAASVTASVNAEASAKPAEAENIAAEARAETAPVETAQSEGSQEAVRALLKKGVISNSEANRVLADAGLRTEFERQTGETLTGTKADQRAQIKRVALTQNITGENARSEARAKSTAIDASPEQHTPEQQASIQDYQNSVDNRVLAFIHKWNGLKNADYKKRARVRLDTVSERAASDLKSTVGVDATGYRHSLDGNALQHIEKRHGKNGEADHSMANENDIARISYVLDNYDSVKPLLNADGSQKLSSMFNNADNTPAPLVLYAKQIDGTYYAVEAAPDSSAHELRIVSAYMTNKNSGSAGKVLNMPPSGPQLTSEVPHRANASTTADSIPAVGKDVNPKIRETLPEGQGAKSAEFGYDEAQTQTHSTDKVLTRKERAMEGLRPEDRTHKVNHDEEVNAKAQERFEADYEGEKADLFGEKQDWDDADTVLAHKIIVNEVAKARESGSKDAYAEVAKLMKEWDAHGTEAGQALRQRRQLASDPALMEADAIQLLNDSERTRKMSDEQRKKILDSVSQNAEKLRSIEKGDVDGVVDLIKGMSTERRTNGLWSKKMGKTMEKALEQAKKLPDGEAFLRDIAASQVRGIAYDYAKPSALEQIKAYRYLSMLSKPATAARNLTGNMVYDPVEAVSNNIGVGLDMLLSKYTGTRSVAADKSYFSKTKRKGMGEATLKSYIETGLDASVSNAQGKYETGGSRSFKMTGNFLERFLSTWEKYNNYAMVTSDQMQKGGIQAESQRGIDALEASGKVAKGALDGRAQETARERTFQNEGKLSGVMGGMRNALNKLSVKDKRGGSIGLGDVMLPFTNVPGNIASAAIQYSPAGFINAGTEIANVVSKVKGTQLTQAGQRTISSKLNSAVQKAQKGKLTAEERAAIGYDIAKEIKKSEGIELTKPQMERLNAAVENYIQQATSKAGAAEQAKALADVSEVLRKAKAGTLTAPEQAKAVTDFGRAFNGTIGIALFAILAGAGVMNVAGDDDEDKEALEKSEGINGTQLNLSALNRWIAGESTEWRDGDDLVSIGFLDPINAQMTYGALLADCYKDEGLSLGNVALGNLESAFQSVMDLPAMSQFQEITNGYKYSKAETPGGKVAEAALRYGASQATSFVPNVVSGVAQGLDGTVRDTYNGDTVWENSLNAMKSKVPVLRETLPAALDNWGQEKKYTGTAAENFLNATLNPGSVTKYRTSAVNQELYRLGSLNIDVKYPEKKAPSDGSRNGKDVDLTQNEKRQYQMAYGQTAYDNIQKLIQSATYKRASETEKAAAIQNLLEVATAAGKKKAKLDGGDTPSWTTKSDGSVADNAVYRAKLTSAKNTLPKSDRDNNGKVMQAIVQTAGSKRGGSDQLALNVMAQELSETTQAKVETAYESGLSLQQVADFYQARYAKKPGTKQNKYKKPDLYAWALQNGYTAAQFNQLWKLFPQ